MHVSFFTVLKEHARVGCIHSTLHSRIGVFIIYLWKKKNHTEIVYIYICHHFHKQNNTATINISYYMECVFSRPNFSRFFNRREYRKPPHVSCWTFRIKSSLTNRTYKRLPNLLATGGSRVEGVWRLKPMNVSDK